MYRIAFILFVEAIVLLGAAIQALLAGYLLVTHGPAPVSWGPSWPATLNRAAHALLWPVARLGGHVAEQASSDVILVAMAVYLALTIAAVAAVKLAVQSPAPPAAQYGRGGRR